ncbi:hypothetical protein [Streptomyces capparidis]
MRRRVTAGLMAGLVAMAWLGLLTGAGAAPDERSRPGCVSREAG